MSMPHPKKHERSFIVGRSCVWRAVLVLLIVGCIGFSSMISADASDAQQTCQTDADGSTTCASSSDEESVFEVVNDSAHRADIYLEDDRFGQFRVTVDAQGGTAELPLSKHGYKHQVYFVTKHGMRQALVNLATDEPYRFAVASSAGSFVIPEEAAPSPNPCKDRYAICVQEAARGECHVNPGWMIVHCCQSCNNFIDAESLIDPQVRCSKEHLNITEPVWKPGDLDNLFQTWATQEEFRPFAPRVLSSPTAEFQPRGDGASNETAGTTRPSPPWILVFDNFLSDDEADALIHGGHLMGFERSTDQGKMNALGEQERVVSTTRTSSNAWCRGRCEALPLVQAVTQRIEWITRIPQSHYEKFQILEYQVQQFYRMHHDSSSTDKVAGPRILTVFLYLSDVEEGGETAFPKLNMVVPPAKGRALIWPSVQNDTPSKPDNRMYHEARPVIRGDKYAANHWIHLYPYEVANRWGCTGAFAVRYGGSFY